MDETVFLKEMGQRIMSRRKSLHFTQEELAEKINVSTQMISNLECGKKAIRPANLAKVCKTLDVSADYVLLGVNTKNQEINLITEKLMKLSNKEFRIVSDLIDYMEDKN